MLVEETFLKLQILFGRTLIDLSNAYSTPENLRSRTVLLKNQGKINICIFRFASNLIIGFPFCKLYVA